MDFFGCVYGTTVKLPWSIAPVAFVLVPSRLTGSRPTAILVEKVKVSPIIDGDTVIDSGMLVALEDGAIVTTGDVTVNVSPRLPMAVTVTCA